MARELSRIAWDIYDNMNWDDKAIMGRQFVRATDSFGANFTEGYSRYHYLDKIIFYYNARASLSEANDYWIELIIEREKTKKENYDKYNDIANKAYVKLQKFINKIYQVKMKQK